MNLLEKIGVNEKHTQLKYFEYKILNASELNTVYKDIDLKQIFDLLGFLGFEFAFQLSSQTWVFQREVKQAYLIDHDNILNIVTKNIQEIEKLKQERGL